MANTLVQTNSSAPGSSNTFTCAFTSNTTKGNLLIVAWRRVTGASTTTVTDSLSNTWVVVYDAVDPSGTINGGWAYCLNAANGGANTVSINFTGGPYAGGVVEIAEWNGPNALRAITAVNTGNSTGPSSGPLNVTTGDLILSVYEAAASGSLPTAGAGYTIAIAGQAGGFYYGAIQYQTAAGSPLSASFTITTSNWTSGMAAFYNTSAAPAFIKSAFNSQGAGATQVQVAIAVQAVGDLLIAGGMNVGPYTGISDNGASPNTWTQLALQGGGYTTIWWAIAKTAGSITLTLTLPGTQTNILAMVAEYSGFYAPSPFDVNLNAAIPTNGTTYNSGNLQTKGPNELYVLFGNNYGSNVAYTTTSGTTMRQNNPNGNTSLYLGDRIFSTAGAHSETGTVPSSPFGAGMFNFTLIPAAGLPKAGGGSGLGYDFRYRF